MIDSPACPVAAASTTKTNIPAITNKILCKMVKEIKTNPIMNLDVLDILDVYNLKTHSPYTEAKQLYRVCQAHLPNDQLINNFAVKMKNFDSSFGKLVTCIKKIQDTSVKKWKEIKTIQHRLKDYKYYEETEGIDLKSFTVFCKTNGVTEKMIWHQLLDDTQTKSPEIIKAYYPTLISIPAQAIWLQKYNSHTMIFTQAQTGKSETCKRIHPESFWGDASVASLLGTSDNNSVKRGMLTGAGVFMFEEISKFIESSAESTKKPLDWLNDYAEGGVARRTVWANTIESKGTKTIMFVGNISPEKIGERNFFSLMCKISTYTGDADKIGRRYTCLVYGMMNKIQPKPAMNHAAHQILMIFNREINNSKKIKDKMLDIVNSSLNWINMEDPALRQKILNMCPDCKYESVRSDLRGRADSAYHKIKFASLRIVILNHIFDLIEGKPIKDFFNKHKDELITEYEENKNLMLLNGLNTLIYGSPADATKEAFINKYFADNNIDINTEIDIDTRRKIADELKTTDQYIKNIITRLRKNVQKQPAPQELSQLAQNPA